MTSSPMSCGARSIATTRPGVSGDRDDGCQCPPQKMEQQENLHEFIWQTGRPSLPGHSSTLPISKRAELNMAGLTYVRVGHCRSECTNHWQRQTTQLPTVTRLQAQNPALTLQAAAQPNMLHWLAASQVRNTSRPRSHRYAIFGTGCGCRWR